MGRLARAVVTEQRHDLARRISRSMPRKALILAKCLRHARSSIGRVRYTPSRLRPVLSHHGDHCASRRRRPT